MKNLKPLLLSRRGLAFAQVLATLSTGLAAPTLTHATNPGSPVDEAHKGGADIGGGSSSKGKFLDKRAQEDTIRWMAGSETYQKMNELDQLLADRLMNFHFEFVSFHFAEATKKRFVLVDELPPVQRKDVKHDVADKLVAIQRGPVVWTLRSFYENASSDEQVAFHVHEFFVAEKLKQGPLNKKSMEEIVNATAFIVESLSRHRAKQIEFPSAETLQAMLNANGFEGGPTPKEWDEIKKFSQLFSKTLTELCETEARPKDKYQKILSLMKYAKAQSTSELSSLDKRKFYAKLSNGFETALKGNHSVENMCEQYHAEKGAEAVGEELGKASPEDKSSGSKSRSVAQAEEKTIVTPVRAVARPAVSLSKQDYEGRAREELDKTLKESALSGAASQCALLDGKALTKGMATTRNAAFVGDASPRPEAEGSLHCEVSNPKELPAIGIGAFLTHSPETRLFATNLTKNGRNALLQLTEASDEKLSLACLKESAVAANQLGADPEFLALKREIETAIGPFSMVYNLNLGLIKSPSANDLSRRPLPADGYLSIFRMNQDTMQSKPRPIDLRELENIFVELKREESPYMNVAWENIACRPNRELALKFLRRVKERVTAVPAGKEPADHEDPAASIAAH